MQVTERSVASTARRTQILDATVEVIAAGGFTGASFRRIAEHAGLSSTRLISYHFAGKDELMSALVEHVVAGIGEHVGGLVMAEETASGRLRAYVEGVVGYSDTHRREMTALLQVVMAGAGGATTQQPSDLSQLERILEEGQRQGEFREFDPKVMATTIQRSVETVPFALQTEPGLDCAAYAHELVELFGRATRADP